MSTTNSNGGSPEEPGRRGFMRAAVGGGLAAPGPPFHAWAPTPPMCWNSWDAFGASVTEAEVLDMCWRRPKIDPLRAIVPMQI